MRIFVVFLLFFASKANAEWPLVADGKDYLIGGDVKLFEALAHSSYNSAEAAYCRARRHKEAMRLENENHAKRNEKFGVRFNLLRNKLVDKYGQFAVAEKEEWLTFGIDCPTLKTAIYWNTRYEKSLIELEKRFAPTNMLAPQDTSKLEQLQ